MPHASTLAPATPPSVAAGDAACTTGPSETATRDRSPAPAPPTHASSTHASAVQLSSLGRSFAARGSLRVRRSAARRTVLRDVSLDIEPGEIVAILGTSGCGKSTLLRIVGGLDAPTTGEVRIDGTPVAPFDARTAVGFQEPRLLPWRTIAANVALGLRRGTPAAAGRERVAKLLELVGLTDFAEHRPREVSGGMAQRASLARALARDPGVLLLDEPFGALDALTRLKMQDLLLDVHAAAPTTVLLVTHDVDEAIHLADRILLLGTPDATADAGTPALPGATIRELVRVPDARSRGPASAERAALRARLLAGLGVETHAAATA